MALPLYLSITSILIGLMFWTLSRYGRSRRDQFDSMKGLFLTFGFVLWIIAVIWKDPIIDFLSADAQLIMAGLALASFLWKYYFDPMNVRMPC